MEAVVGLLVMLLGVSYGVENVCDGRQDGAQCYRALGGTVVLQLMDNTSQISRYQWKKKTLVILSGAKNRFKFESDLTEQNKYIFNSSRGTLQINNLSRNDSGNYTLEIYNSTGQKSLERTLLLSIQAPVSSVQLVSQCLSQGELRVSCSSEGGDSPQYSWTLNGHALTDAELLSGDNDANKITLKQNILGNLVCSVRNHVSNVSKEETISSCGFIFISCISNGTPIAQWVFEANNTLCIPTPPPTTVTITTVGKETAKVSNTPSTNITAFNQTMTSSKADLWYNSYLSIMAVVLLALVIFLGVGVAVICVQKKKKNNKLKEEEDENELTYADVRIVKREGRQVQQRPDVESVEYGQVKFSERPRQTEPMGDDSVYAKVRKVR